MDFIDFRLFSLLHSLAGRSSLLDSVIYLSAAFLPYFIILAALWAVTHLFSWREKFYAISLALTSILIGWGVFSAVAKYFYLRLPPASVVEDITPLVNLPASSLPAASVIITASVAVSLFFFNRRWGSSLFILSCLIGLARIIAAVSWPTDIIVSLAVGILIPLLFRPLINPNN